MIAALRGNPRVDRTSNVRLSKCNEKCKQVEYAFGYEVNKHHTYTHTHKDTHKDTHTYTHRHTYTHAHTSTHTDTHTHIYAHTHSQTHAVSPVAKTKVS
jgi:hypothetical protein